MAVTEKPVRPLTGWHVLAMFVAFFGVIIAVNAGLAWKAISTFPGLEVDNGYIASQSFDAERSAQRALNWTLAHGYDAGARELRLTFTDAQGGAVALGGGGGADPWGQYDRSLAQCDADPVHMADGRGAVG